LNFDIEERKKLLNTTYFDEFITSDDDENQFEENDLVEEGEIIDPMMI